MTCLVCVCCVFETRSKRFTRAQVYDIYIYMSLLYTISRVQCVNIYVSLMASCFISTEHNTRLCSIQNSVQIIECPEDSFYDDNLNICRLNAGGGILLVESGVGFLFSLYGQSSPQDLEPINHCVVLLVDCRIKPARTITSVCCRSRAMRSFTTFA